MSKSSLNPGDAVWATYGVLPAVEKGFKFCAWLHDPEDLHGQAAPRAVAERPGPCWPDGRFRVTVTSRSHDVDLAGIFDPVDVEVDLRLVPAVPPPP
jgi:hypothetical protein